MSTRLMVDAIALSLAVLVSSCGGSDSSPSAVGESLTVSVPPVVAVAESVAVTASAAGVAVSGTWRSADPAIASVTASGRVTGVRTGQTTVTVTYRGAESAATVRVVPECQGEWSGTYRLQTCTPGPTEAYRAAWCTGVEGTTGTVTFTMARSGATVTEQSTVNGIAFPAAVTQIAADGSIEFASTASTTPARQTAAQWTVNSSSPGQLAGTAHWVISGTGGLIGWGTVEGTVSATSSANR